MVADRVFWYRRILTMAVIALSMVFLCTRLINDRKADGVLTGNSGTLIYPCGFPVGSAGPGSVGVAADRHSQRQHPGGGSPDGQHRLPGL